MTFGDSEVERYFQLYVMTRNNNGDDLSDTQIQMLREELLSISVDREEQLAMLRKATTGLWKGFYPLSKPKKKKSESAQKAKKKSFNNFDGRKYDMDALEAQMLAADEVRGCK